ncbi:Phosphoacetylglucosamine mutase [Acorus calamus]|uniref:Phosphoacetylglucosamine mutase n=1 Tax=Acorus calamus TaxID=4465 RepID=A0AAV9DY74_ACOCL|nr:Phosphoacetylglucosamine mutase [Acorus calamus]
MEEKQLKILLQSASRFPPGKKKFLYGTAGFRGEASMLESTVFKAGIMAALRSLKAGLVVGLMITASHNPVSDNGVKIADPSGGMMTQDWEPFADALALAPDPDHLVELIVQFAKKENIPFGGTQSAEILLGRDTRPSGEALLEAAKKGIDAIVNSVAVDMGILTTPQLHWVVRRRNMEMKASEFDYFALLSASYRSLVDLIPTKTLTGTSDVKLTVDAANGVGGEKIKQLSKLLTGLEIEVRNSGKEGEGILNEKVGADYVQKEKFAPLGFGPHDVGTREQLTILNKENGNESSEFPVKLGIVQTAYANGASTEYLKQLGLDVVFTPTGVKYLHEKALEYDIGIYFEANGHGTILFSEAFMPRLESKSAELSSVTPGSEQQKAVLRLLAVSTLINQAVGDALSGLLLVEAILQYLGWSIERWSELYCDLPSRQLKVSVADRNAVVTTNAETTVVKPSGLQELINYETAKYPKGRSFIRPSGTEDVIRVYAEASTQEVADSLAQAVAQHVNCFLGRRYTLYLLIILSPKISGGW